MLKKTIIRLLFIFSLSMIVSAQTPDAKTKEKAEKLKADAVSFLRETSSEVANLRTPENRIGFNAELAGLMWLYDEKEARVMFNSVTNDFRQLLVGLDAQINSVKFEDGNTEMYSVPFMRGGANQQAQISRKFYKAMSVRQQIASTLSDHDALLAYSFYNDTATVITNPKFRKQLEDRDQYFEMKLLQAIAGQDAAKGLEFGRKSLAKGVNGSHIELLKKIYAKDADSGAAFGEEIVSKLKSDSGDAENFYIFDSLINLGLENKKAVKDKPTQKPIFSEQVLRDLAETTAQKLLEQPAETISAYSGTIDKIEKISPNRAVQLRQKQKTASASVYGSNVMVGNKMMAVVERSVPPEPTVPAVNTEKEMLENMQKIGTKKLSDEERTKAIAEANKMIEKIEDPSAKMLALGGFASQIAKAGDKDLALQFMKQAESLVNTTPKNYLDYMQMWVLAAGYAQIEPEKSFPILETAIYNLNDTVSAFIKVAEFIDTNNEIMEDGEVQVSGFGGGGITRELLSGLSVSNETLKNLAEADFTRTRNLTNKFDRTEVRILAKMLVIRALLGDANKKSSDLDVEPGYGMIEN